MRTKWPEKRTMKASKYLTCGQCATFYTLAVYLGNSQNEVPVRYCPHFSETIPITSEHKICTKFTLSRWFTCSNKKQHQKVIAALCFNRHKTKFNGCRTCKTIKGLFTLFTGKIGG